MTDAKIYKLYELSFMKKIFSGIQPSGNIHLGNYLGALKQWVALQNGNCVIATPSRGLDSVRRSPQGAAISAKKDCFAEPRNDREKIDRNDNNMSLRGTKQSNPELSLIFCIVDLHAITVPQDPKVLQEKILELTALYIACGIDPTKSKIFVQSSRPEHSELAWILNCNTYMGELNRMTQFKEKSENKTNYSVGLFDYPALMAADILLYQTTHVPVGEDQKQHIELTRDLAQRMNSKYTNQKATPGVAFGDIFTIPEPIIKKETARIMGLDDATKKMSKSAPSPANYIALTDEPEIIRQKIKKAVTDSGSEIKSGTDKPAITNLLNIFSGVTDKSVEDLEKEFSGKQYGEFKVALADAVVAFLEPIQVKYKELRSNEAELRRILEEGSKAVEPEAQETLKKVKNAVGLGL